MSDNTELKRLVDLVLTDRRFCGDENHKALADGVLSLIAELDLAQTIGRLAYNFDGYKAVLDECDQLKAESESLRGSCKAMGADMGKLTRERNSFRSQAEKARAEVAGLRTGYEAYEQVNAELKAEVEKLRNAAAPPGPVNGDQLPAINSKVLIHLSSCDAWVEHTVVGYYAWEDLGANEYLHRVFVRVRDADGYINARLSKDVRSAAALGQGEQSC